MTTTMISTKDAQIFGSGTLGIRDRRLAIEDRKAGKVMSFDPRELQTIHCHGHWAAA